MLYQYMPYYQMLVIHLKRNKLVSKFISGHGLVVETHFGRIRIADSEFHHNMGNGIKTKFVDGKWPMFDERDTFCRATSVGSNTFPTVMSAIPIRGAYNSRCDQVSLYFNESNSLEKNIQYFTDSGIE